MEVFPDDLTSLTYKCVLGACILSCTGCLFVICSIYKFPSLRAFPFRMVGWLASADLGICFAYFLGTGAGTGHFRCYLQGVSYIYFNLVSIFLSVGLAHLVRLMVGGGPGGFGAARAAEGRVLAVSFSVPAALALLPLATDDYGDTGAWCSISGDGGGASWDTGEIWMFFCFYLPLWLGVAYISFCYTAVYRNIRGVRRAWELAYGSAGEEERKEGGGGGGRGGLRPKPDSTALEYSRRVWLYPVVLAACYFFATLDKIIILCTGQGVFSIYLLEFVTIGLSGCCDALVYGATGSVRAAWAAEARRLRGPGAPWWPDRLLCLCRPATVATLAAGGGADPAALLAGEGGGSGGEEGPGGGA